MWSVIFEIVADAALDSLLILPFLLVLHIAIEVFEANTASKMRLNKVLSSKHAPFFGSAVGLIPQCGFSVVATKLYSGKKIRLGTLLAVFIATSDEAIPVILATPSAAVKVVPLLVLKFVTAVIVGYAVNLVLLRRECKAGVFLRSLDAEGSSEGVADANRDGKTLTSNDDCRGRDADRELASGIGERSVGCHGHTIGRTVGEEMIKGRFDFDRYVLHPLLHSLTVFSFIFAVNLVMGTVLEFVGEDRLTSFLNSISYIQPILAGLIGLIPNCAGSVVIAQMYAVGSLSLGAAFAGLAVNAGIAFAVLFKENKPFKNNLYIIGFLYVLGVVIGIIVTLLGF